VADTYEQNNHWEKEDDDYQHSQYSEAQHVDDDEMRRNACSHPTDTADGSGSPERRVESPVFALRERSDSVTTDAAADTDTAADENHDRSSVSESERKRRRRAIVPDTYAFEDLAGDEYVGEDLDDGREDYHDSPMIGSHCVYGTSWYNEEEQDEDEGLEIMAAIVDEEGVASGSSAFLADQEEENEEPDWVEGYLTQGCSTQLLKTNSNTPALAASPARTTSPPSLSPSHQQEQEQEQGLERKIYFRATTAGSPFRHSSAGPMDTPPLSGPFNGCEGTQMTCGAREGVPSEVADTYAASSGAFEEEEEDLGRRDSSNSVEEKPEEMMSQPAAQHQQHQQQQDSSRTTLGERGLSYYDGSSMDLQPAAAEMLFEARSQPICGSSQRDLGRNHDTDDMLSPAHSHAGLRNDHLDPSQMTSASLAVAAIAVAAEDEHPSLSGASQSLEGDQTDSAGPGLSQLSTCGYMEYQVSCCCVKLPII
jgi:hypothetical protein